jgi:hypothetical protein
MASISPICKKCKNFNSALKSPTYRDFVIKKLLKFKTSKSHTWPPLSQVQNLCSSKELRIVTQKVGDLDRLGAAASGAF